MVRKPSRLLTKKGRYGSSKVKAFKIIWEYPGLPSRQLCIYAGIPYHSLARVLKRWTGWEYVSRQPVVFGGKYEYYIELKAKRWLRLAEKYLNNYQLFVDELKAWQDYLPDEAMGDMASMPFNDFVATLDTRIKEFQKNNGKRY